MDVNVYQFGKRIQEITGVMDNIYIGNLVADIFDLSEKMKEIQDSYTGWTFEPYQEKRSVDAHGYKYASHD